MPKKLSSLSKSDLNNRIKTQEKNLAAAKKSGNKKAQKQAEQSLAAIRQEKKTRTEKPKTLSAKEQAQKAYNKVLASKEFQLLSPANQQLLKTMAESYTPQQLKDLSLSKKEMQLIHADVLTKAAKSLGIPKDQFDLDREQTLRKDMDKLQKLILIEAKKPLSEQRDQTIRQLQDALGDAKYQYNTVAQQKNEYLQTQLADINYQLETESGRTEEDKIRQLQRLQRTYNTQLRETQQNMSQRGLAFSGVRARAEDDLAEDYEDNRTTVQLEAARRAQDVQRLAMEQQRDLTTATQQELQQLMNTYNVTAREAAQGAEGVLGTQQTQQILGQEPMVAGAVPTTGLTVGNVQGTYDRAALQTEQSQLAGQKAAEQALVTGKLMSK
jgi:hypothetical protein